MPKERPEHFYAVLIGFHRTIWKMTEVDFLAQKQAKGAAQIGIARPTKAQAMAEFDKLPRRK